MDNDMLRKQFYAGFIEILTDPKYYYFSSVGTDYCRFTEEGTKAVSQFLSIMAPHMVRGYQEELLEMAKDLTWDALKK